MNSKRGHSPGAQGSKHPRLPRHAGKQSCWLCLSDKTRTVLRSCLGCWGTVPGTDQFISWQICPGPHAPKAGWLRSIPRTNIKISLVSLDSAMCSTSKGIKVEPTNPSMQIGAALTVTRQNAPYSQCTALGRRHVYCLTRGKGPTGASQRKTPTQTGGKVELMSSYVEGEDGYQEVCRRL